jgi:hypothetical protein
LDGRRLIIRKKCQENRSINKKGLVAVKFPLPSQTNIRALTDKTPLEPAGMLGPVQLPEASPAQ